MFSRVTIRSTSQGAVQYCSTACSVRRGRSRRWGHRRLYYMMVHREVLLRFLFSVGQMCCQRWGINLSMHCLPAQRLGHKGIEGISTCYGTCRVFVSVTESIRSVLYRHVQAKLGCSSLSPAAPRAQRRVYELQIVVVTFSRILIITQSLKCYCTWCHFPLSSMRFMRSLNSLGDSIFVDGDDGPAP